MIEVRKRGEGNGRLKTIATFNSIEELLTLLHDNNFTAFGYLDTDRTKKTYIAGIQPRPTDRGASIILETTQFCFVVYDDNGNFITPDRLVGMYRKYYRSLVRSWNIRWNKRCNGGNRGLYGGYRHFRTFQEGKWAKAWDDEEFAARCRPCRNAVNLPCYWDDLRRHVEKSWKSQSKRRHQWK